MIDIRDKSYCPTLEEIGETVKNPVFFRFCTEVMARYSCKEKIEFSSCSWEYGWNIKFKKSGKSLCTVYPRENYFTVLVVIGQKEKKLVEEVLPECSSFLREIYENTKEGNGQRWLMIDLEDRGEVYGEVLRLMDVRRETRR